MTQVTRAIDVTHIAFVPLAELERVLIESINTMKDPTTLIRVICRIAHSLLDPSDTESQARTQGWASLAVRHQRGRDMIEIIARLPAAPIRDLA
ncbi:hypothetical protein [Variovorax sp. Sphag1AA]|uniref:hypothetical protein n=1 Tax=Variovorax sp. Sphag1AA TaxID=2587027 RepID=UPI0016198066|nr:hypothetical protein [Variovorax sp. Sphag1AA]MBB3179737.1 hypothetical protein [Variovorax sp. Sphag1AA]